MSGPAVNRRRDRHGATARPPVGFTGTHLIMAGAGTTAAPAPSQSQAGRPPADTGTPWAGPDCLVGWVPGTRAFGRTVHHEHGQETPGRRGPTLPDREERDLP